MRSSYLFSTELRHHVLSLPTLCLETGVEADQERIGGGLLKHVFLRLNPVDILPEDQRRQFILNDQDTPSPS